MINTDENLQTTRSLVSIALCTYNGEHYIRKQLDSLVAQSYSELEIIVTDDNSTDATWDILQEYAAKYAQFNIEKNKKNLGYIDNFEKTLERCNGSYIALCDQDDIWLPEKITTLVSEIGDSSLVYSAPSYIGESDEPINMPPFKVNRLSGRCPLSLLFHTCVTGHLALMKKDVLKRALPFPPNIQAHDRWIPFVAAAMNGIKAIDTVLSFYRIHSNNVSRVRNVETGLINKMIRRRRQVHERLEDRISSLENAGSSGLLTDAEQKIVSELTRETKELKHSFVNLKLNRLLINHQDKVLSLYINKEKKALRFSRGIFYYAMLLYLIKT